MLLSTISLVPVTSTVEVVLLKRVTTDSLVAAIGVTNLVDTIVVSMILVAVTVPPSTVWDSLTTVVSVLTDTANFFEVKRVVLVNVRL